MMVLEMKLKLICAPLLLVVSSAAAENRVIVEELGPGGSPDTVRVSVRGEFERTNECAGNYCNAYGDSRLSIHPCVGDLTCVSYGSPLFYYGINQHSLPFTSEAYELELDLDTSYEIRGYWYLEFTSDCSAHPVCSEVFDQTRSFPQIVPTDGSSWTALKVRFGV